MSETVKAPGFIRRASARYTAETAKAVLAAAEAWQKVEPGRYDAAGTHIADGDFSSVAQIGVDDAGMVATTEFFGRPTIKLMPSEPSTEGVDFAYASNPRRESNLGVTVTGNETDGYRLTRNESGRRLRFPNLIAPLTLRRVRRAAEQFGQRAAQLPQRRA